MTDTAREAAIERVRAYVEACGYDDREIVNTAEDCDLTAGDLRLLLTDPRQPGEAGGENTDDRPLDFGPVMNAILSDAIQRANKAHAKRNPNTPKGQET